MFSIVRTNPADKDVRALVDMLTGDLKVKDGDEHAFYSQFNNLDTIKHSIVAYVDGEPVGCGSIRRYNDDSMELKRMFVRPGFRGKGIAGKMVAELESWARELGYRYCILETGVKMPDAIRLYEKSGYTRIDNFDPYTGIDSAVCMKKILAPDESN